TCGAVTQGVTAPSGDGSPAPAVEAGVEPAVVEERAVVPAVEPGVETAVEPREGIDPVRCEPGVEGWPPENGRAVEAGEPVMEAEAVAVPGRAGAPVAPPAVCRLGRLLVQLGAGRGRGRGDRIGRGGGGGLLSGRSFIVQLAGTGAGREPEQGQRTEGGADHRGTSCADEAGRADRVIRIHVIT